MKLAVVCEAPPTTDRTSGDGSTMISAQLLSRLPGHWEIRLAHFADRDAETQSTVADRSTMLESLPLRSRRASLLADIVTRLPRATWQRDTSRARALVEQLSSWADVTYLHGLHTFGLAEHVLSPLVVHEVDPWSDHWAQRAQRGGAGGWYDRRQAAKADRLERHVADRANRFLVVSPDDADRLTARIGRQIDALPNGCALAEHGPAAPELADRRSIAFIGSLDYAPNVAAARCLVEVVAPIVRRSIPDLRVVLAGRSPTEPVRALVGDGVELHADVADMRDEIAAVAAVVLPGSAGFGVRNAVLESIAVGRPVVATRSSGRGLRAGRHLIVEDDPARMAHEVATMLLDRGRWETCQAEAARRATEIPTWDTAAARFGEILTSATSGRAVRSRSAPPTDRRSPATDLS